MEDVKSIQAECELMYKQIADAKERLKELRSICKHTETHIGNYSYRIGSFRKSEICSICGELIKYGIEG